MKLKITKGVDGGWIPNILNGDKMIWSGNVYFNRDQRTLLHISARYVGEWILKILANGSEQYEGIFIFVPGNRPDNTGKRCFEYAKEQAKIIKDIL